METALKTPINLDIITENTRRPQKQTHFRMEYNLSDNSQQVVECGPDLKPFYEEHTEHQHHNERRDHAAVLEESTSSHDGAVRGPAQHAPASLEQEGWPVSLKRIPAMKKVLSDLYEMDSSTEEEESPHMEMDKLHRRHDEGTTRPCANDSYRLYPGQIVTCFEEELNFDHTTDYHSSSITRAECNEIPSGTPVDFPTECDLPEKD